MDYNTRNAQPRSQDVTAAALRSHIFNEPCKGTVDEQRHLSGPETGGTGKHYHRTAAIIHRRSNTTFTTQPVPRPQCSFWNTEKVLKSPSTVAFGSSMFSDHLRTKNSIPSGPRNNCRTRVRRTYGEATIQRYQAANYAAGLDRDRKNDSSVRDNRSDSQAREGLLNTIGRISEGVPAISSRRSLLSPQTFTSRLAEERIVHPAESLTPVAPQQPSCRRIQHANPSLTPQQQGRTTRTEDTDHYRPTLVHASTHTTRTISQTTTFQTTNLNPRSQTHPPRLQSFLAAKPSGLFSTRNATRCMSARETKEDVDVLLERVQYASCATARQPPRGEGCL